jgi:5-carboxymethyl-2-hydroxymuconate isomerase
MPHLRIEYSANLATKIDMGAYCATMRDTILATGLFELGAVRVRAFKADAYAIADQMPDNAFIDMVFRIGQGRTETERKAAGDAIFASAEQALKPLFETPHFALSLEIVEIDSAFSWKKNAMHARLRGQ